MDRWLFSGAVDKQGICSHAVYMFKTIQIRNMPDALHHKLKARAASAGMSLSDYLLLEIRQVAERPTEEEIHERVLARIAAERIGGGP